MKIKIPSNKNQTEIENFFIKKNLSTLVSLSKKKKKLVNQMILKEPYIPDLNDLYFLYQFVIMNKRITILEFGSGWSTLIFNLALKELKDKYLMDVKLLRRNNPFELFVIENEKKYLNITKQRVKKLNRNNNIIDQIKTNYHFSDVEMTLFKDKICHQYKKLPTCSPDFIYLDGPDQFKVKKDINGISTRHKDMLPMACDILKLEYFYTPGTIIVSDGRSANISLLRNNFQRKWNYLKNKSNDQHILWLDDAPLGKFNKMQLEFYRK